MARSEEVVADLIREMHDETDSTNPGTPEQLSDMALAVSEMTEAGLFFSEEVIREIAAGEQGEVELKYSRYAGFERLHRILDDVFEG